MEQIQIISAVDFSKFKEELELDDDNLKELYSVFLEELIRENQKMKQHFKNKDIVRLKRTIHNIKGISGNYKALRVCNLSSEVYEQLKIEDKEYINLGYSINKMEKLIEDVIKEIRQVLN
jgi:HPt (histidine-containing phosphotransfer) domain-containing protein